MARQSDGTGLNFIYQGTACRKRRIIVSETMGYTKHLQRISHILPNRTIKKKILHFLGFLLSDQQDISCQLLLIRVDIKKLYQLVNRRN